MLQYHRHQITDKPITCPGHESTCAHLTDKRVLCIGQTHEMLNLEFTGDIGHVTFTLASTRNVDIYLEIKFIPSNTREHTDQQSLASEALVLGFPHCAMINQVLSAALEPSNAMSCNVMSCSRNCQENVCCPEL